MEDGHSKKPTFPAELKPLDELAHNLWFCWNQEALDLFRQLDAKIWEEVDQNPVELLQPNPLQAAPGTRSRS